MAKITIEFIPHTSQRYDTCGDWQWDGEDLNIKISVTDDYRTNYLVAIHELIEAFLCKVGGITEEQVDNWDLSFIGEGEPGIDPNCPYYVQHVIATDVEVLLSHAVRIDWVQHNKNLEDLPEWKD